VSSIVFRRARRDDLPALVTLIADDDVNGHREDASEPLDPGYVAAFAAIEHDPDNILVVGEADGAIVATAQISFIPTLGQRGATRAIVEGVRVASAMRSRGYGEMLLAHLEGLARERGCLAVQLTTSMARVKAHRFYERIGYARTHKGFKREL
jgi:GNAT superfamily N-acetyltransferase